MGEDIGMVLMAFQPQYIIIHHSLTIDGSTVSWQAIRDWHTGRNKASPYRWRDIGYHFGIERINSHYEVLVGRTLDEIGAHTRGANNNGIGICVVGNFDLAPPNGDQYRLTAKLVKSLMRVCNVPLGLVKGHRDFANKSCPGSHFDMHYLKQLTHNY